MVTITGSGLGHNDVSAVTLANIPAVINTQSPTQIVVVAGAAPYNTVTQLIGAVVVVSPTTGTAQFQSYTYNPGIMRSLSIAHSFSWHNHFSKSR